MMRRRGRLETRVCGAGLTIALALVGMPAAAGSPAGGLPPGVLEAIPADAATVEIDLQGAMLRLVAAATQSDEPEFAALVRGLDRIQVRFSEGLEGETAPLLAAFEVAGESLRKAGWSQQVSVREGGERVLMFGREEAGRLVGLAVLFLEEDEAGVIYLEGEVDPDRLGLLTRGLDLPDLGIDPEDRP